MKLTFFLMTAAFLQVSAGGNAQTVTYSGKKVKLEAVFSAVEQQTGYAFFYNDQDLRKAGPVSVNLREVPLPEAVQRILKGQPFSYTITGKTIVVSYVPAKLPGVVDPDSDRDEADSPPPIDISGRVTDADGNPLVGASVKVKGSSLGTTTNNDGVFVLKGVDENATLEISFVGYQTYTIAVANKTSIAASLKLKPESLNEVVINKGYYTEKQKVSVSDVRKVTAKEIEKQPVSNPLLALQGRIPSLFVTQSTGLPGSGVTVRIQGQNSISSGNDPLYIIDGVPYVSQLLPNLATGILRGSGGVVINGRSASGGGNPLSYINPSDIESIEVLKDADATSIYGSRAANGAILVTTKKGRAGKTKLDLNFQTGWGKVPRQIDLLNTQQYLQMRLEAKRNDNLAISATDYDINGFWDTTRYTDWQKELIGGTAQYTDVQTTISGGSTATQFSIGGGYHKEGTVFPGDFDDTKGSLHFNLNNTSSNQKFHIQLSSSYTIDRNQLLQTDFTPAALQLAPNAPKIFNDDGTLNWMVNQSGSSTWTNPFSNLYNTYRNKTSNLISSTMLSYRVLPSVEIKSSVGFNDLRSEEYLPNPLVALPPQSRPTTSRQAQYGTSAVTSWISETQVGYKQLLFEGDLSILLGTTFQSSNNRYQQLYGTGYNNDNVLEDILSASSVMVLANGVSEYKYNAVYSRINYNWKDKYVFNITARKDGSSRFGPKNKFNNFGAVGAAWIFTNERFINKNVGGILTFGKLRANYGTTGSDQIGDYRFLDLYTPINAGVGYQSNSPGLQVNGHSNPYLEWEETRKLHVGVDLGFFNDKIALTTNFIRNRSSNQLLSYALPFNSGFNGVTRNFPATVENTAWEFSLASTIKNYDFTWNASMNLTIPKNKLIAFPNLSSSSYSNSLIIGRPVTINRYYHFLGVNPSNGVYQFADRFGNPTSTPDFSADRTVLLNSLPQFYGGFQNSVTIKSFQLDFLFQLVKQKGLNYLFGNAFGALFNTNQPEWISNSWHKPGDNAQFQRYYSSFGLFSQASNARASDAGFADASFIRLKNMSLSWNLPQKWKQKISLENCRLYAQGQNLLTITKYLGLDPENLSTLSLPPLRVITVGLNATF